MPNHILSFVWVFICRMPGKRKAVTQPRAPKRRGRPRRGQEGDSSSSQSPVRTLRRGQVGHSSEPTQVRLRRGQDGDSSQPPPIRGRPKRRQVEVSSQQLPPTIPKMAGPVIATGVLMVARFVPHGNSRTHLLANSPVWACWTRRPCHSLVGPPGAT